MINNSSGVAGTRVGDGSGGDKSRVTVGARCTIAQDTDVRGRVHFGDGTVVHPKAVIHAPLDGESGNIVIGAECIIEELAHIVHRGTGTMTIGDRNLFEVGCRVESPSIGSHNTFECKSRTTNAVVIRDFTTVGTGCIAQPPVHWETAESTTTRKEDDENGGVATTTPIETASRLDHLYAFPSRTVVYGEESKVRLWSGNGVRQADALHAKHLDHLRRNIPEFHALRIIK